MCQKCTKNVLQTLLKSVLIPLGLTAAASAADAGIYKKILASGTATLIISNEEMEDMKILKSLSKTTQNEAKEQNGGFLGILLGTLSTGLIGNMLAGKGINRAGDGIIISSKNKDF